MFTNVRWFAKLIINTKIKINFNNMLKNNQV